MNRRVYQGGPLDEPSTEPDRGAPEDHDQDRNAAELHGVLLELIDGPVVNVQAAPHAPNYCSKRGRRPCTVRVPVRISGSTPRPLERESEGPLGWVSPPPSWSADCRLRALTGGIRAATDVVHPDRTRRKRTVTQRVTVDRRGSSREEGGEGS